MFERIPLLLYGLLFALTLAFCLTHHFIVLALIIILISFRPNYSLIIVTAAFFYGISHYPLTPSNKGPYLFHVTHITQKSGKFYVRGEIDGTHTSSYFRLKSLPDDLSDLLELEGFYNKGEILLKEDIRVIESTDYTLTRFRMKAWVKNKILEFTPHERSGELLAALITGDLDNKIVRKDFSRFGLQHILAISGFHFSFLAMGVAFLLARFLPYRIIPLALILILASYFLFLGPSGSIIRAWIAIFMASLAEINERDTPPLNSLGIGLFAVSLWNPHALLEGGFILSFVLTAFILLFAKPFDKNLSLLFRPRSYKKVRSVSFFDQLALFILSFLRKSVSLNAAVLIAAVPLTLYFFNAFPLLSLFFNLFYPTLIALSLFLFLLSWIPGVAFLNSYYLDSILNLIHEVPESLDVMIEVNYLKVEFVIVYIAFFLFWGLYKKDKTAYDSYSI